MTIQLHEQPSDLEIDTGKVVEAIVATGDYSRMTEGERGQIVVSLCRGLRLNPFTKPFDFIKMQGKLTLYANRSCADQLAAVHRINRKLIRGPEVTDILGKKMVIAVCEATMPNGRVEQSTATCDIADQCGVFNVLMKCETKAKRRATFAILGLAILDEMEVETVAGVAKQDAKALPEGSAALAYYRENTPLCQSVEAVREHYVDLAIDLRREGREPAEYMEGAYALASDRVRALGLRANVAEVRALLVDGEAGKKLAQRCDDVLKHAGSLDAAARLWVALRAEATKDELAVLVKILSRTAAQSDPSDAQATKAAGKALMDAVAGLGQRPDNDPTPSGPSGGKRLQGTTSTEAHGAVQEGQQSGGASMSVTTLPHVPAWAATPDGIRAHLSTKGTRSEIENSVRVHGKALGAAYQTPAAERLVAVSTPSDDGARLGMIGASILVEGWAFQGPRVRRAGGAR